MGDAHRWTGSDGLGIRDDVGSAQAFHAVLDGLHLLTAPHPALQETLESLREYAVQAVYPCHGSGEKAVAFLKEKLPGTVFEMGAGMIIDF